MTSPDPQHGNDPAPAAGFSQRPDSAGESTQRGSSPDQSAERYAHPEAALGGADAVEKTTYVAGRSAEPAVVNTDRPTAHPSAGGGVNVMAWGVGIVVAIIALIYLAGLFR